MSLIIINIENQYINQIYIYAYKSFEFNNKKLRKPLTHDRFYPLHCITYLTTRLIYTCIL